MDTEIRCDGCQRRYRVRPEQVGHRFRCSCGAELRPQALPLENASFDLSALQIDESAFPALKRPRPAASPVEPIARGWSRSTADGIESKTERRVARLRAQYYVCLGLATVGVALSVGTYLLALVTDAEYYLIFTGMIGGGICGAHELSKRIRRVLDPKYRPLNWPLYVAILLVIAFLVFFVYLVFWGF